MFPAMINVPSTMLIHIYMAGKQLRRYSKMKKHVQKIKLKKVKELTDM